MTFNEVVMVFDDVRYDHPEYPEQPGTIVCCGLPVVKSYGHVHCPRCGRRVAAVGRQWMCIDWGSRGIKLSGW